jgi:hypothetical protein
MPKSNRDPSVPETGEHGGARPQDLGSAANERVDAFDATTVTLGHAAEDRPLGTPPDENEVAYAAGWIFSSFVTLTTVFAVWIFAI